MLLERSEISNHTQPENPETCEQYLNGGVIKPGENPPDVRYSLADIKKPLMSSQEDLDGTGNYFREINRVDLLTAEEEVELAKAIEAAKEAGQRLISEKLSDQTREELKGIITEGDKARQHLTEANLRLVVSIAKKYSRTKVPLLDLIQEGNIGLMRAVEKYDWRKGYKFSTYAFWWIRQAIGRTLPEQAYDQKVPAHVHGTIVGYLKQSQVLYSELGREPTTEEVARIMNMDPKQLEFLLTATLRTVSLFDPIGDDGAMRIDFLGDKGINTEDEVMQGTEVNMINLAMQHSLSQREKKVLVLRFGLEDGKQRILEEVGEELGVTRERIRQIEAKALRKLSRSKYLDGWTDGKIDIAAPTVNRASYKVIESPS